MASNKVGYMHYNPPVPTTSTVAVTRAKVESCYTLNELLLALSLLNDLVLG